MNDRRSETRPEASAGHLAAVADEGPFAFAGDDGAQEPPRRLSIPEDDDAWSMVEAEWFTISRRVESDLRAAPNVASRMTDSASASESTRRAQSTDAIPSSGARHLDVVRDRDQRKRGRRAGRPSAAGRAELCASSLRSAAIRISPSRVGLCAAWSWVSLVCMATIAEATSLHAYLAAAVVAICRIVATLMFPPPYPIGRKHRDRARPSYPAAVRGHLGDLLALLGLASASLTSRDALTSLVLLAGIAAMLGGTMARLAAYQQPDIIRRLVLERAVRNGSLLVALLAATAAGTSWLMIAAIGPGLFGIVEMWRVRQKYQQNISRRQNQTPKAQEADRYKEWVASVSPYDASDAGRKAASVAQG